MDKIWITLLEEAKKKLNTQEISPFIEFGNTSCAILSKNNNIYCGISITSNTGISCSAEKNAVTSMFNNQEKIVKRMVILNELEELIPPSENCYEFLLELCEEFGDMEILLDSKKGEVKNLKDLLPDWWGTYRNNK